MAFIPYFLIERNFSIILNTWWAGSPLQWTGAAGLSSPGVAPAPERVYSENKRSLFCSSAETLNNAGRCVQERHIDTYSMKKCTGADSEANAANGTVLVCRPAAVNR